jgi:FlaG/FlaF family flagellin (archaellin)
MPQVVKNIVAVLITVIIAAVIVGVAFLYVHLYDASAQRDWNNTQETNQACLDMVDSNIKSDISSIKNPSVRKLMQDQHSALVTLGRVTARRSETRR